MRVDKDKVEQLFDILLSSVYPELVPDKLGWDIANAVKEKKIYTREGAKLIIKAASLCEPEKTKDILGKKK